MSPITTQRGDKLPDQVRPEFSSAHWKIERARQHVRALKDAVDSWGPGDGYEIATACEPETGEKTARIIYEAGGLPVLWSLIIGDAVQTLRNALDNAVFGMAKARGSLTEQQERKLAFPIYGRTPLSPGKANRMMRNVPLQVTDFIASIQPHKEVEGPYRDNVLWLLNELAITDKHRTMHLAILQTKTLKASGPPGLGHLGVQWLVAEPPGTTLEHGAEVARYLPLSDVEGDVQIDLTLDVIIKGSGSVPPVSIGVLDQIGTYVERNVIQEIAAIYEEVVRKLVEP
jgi:hypothetical protein